MSKRKVPDTSRAAGEAIKDKLPNHYQRIVEALQIIGKGNYEAIGAIANMDKHAIGRRLKFMRDADPPMIIMLESKSLTKSGNLAYDYTLSEHYTLKGEHPASQLIGKVKSANEFLKNIKQPELF